MKRKIGDAPHLKYQFNPTVSMRIKALGSKMSSIRCTRSDCRQRITQLAKQMGDPYCSRICAEKSLGTYEKNHTIVTSVDMRKRRGRMVIAS